MANRNYILSILLLLAGLLYLANVTRFKMTGKSFVNQYKPGTDGYKSYARLASFPALSIAFIGLLLLVAFMLYNLHTLTQASVSQYILVTDTVAGILSFGLLLGVAYFVNHWVNR